MLKQRRPSRCHGGLSATDFLRCCDSADVRSVTRTGCGRSDQRKKQHRLPRVACFSRASGAMSMSMLDRSGTWWISDRFQDISICFTLSGRTSSQ